MEGALVWSLVLPIQEVLGFWKFRLHLIWHLFSLLFFFTRLGLLAAFLEAQILWTLLKLDALLIRLVLTSTGHFSYVVLS